MAAGKKNKTENEKKNKEGKRNKGKNGLKTT